MSMQSARIFLFRIHQWLGLNTCILLGIMFLTGTLLVFATEIETAFYAKAKSGDLPDGRPISFGQVFDHVQAAYPDARVANIERSDTGAIFGDRTQIATKWRERAVVWSDPGTGEHLGLSPLPGVRYLLLTFHDSLFTGKGIGQAVVSVLAISLLASVLSGLIAYRRFWRALKTPPPRGRGPRPWWGGLHRMIAVWSLPFLLTVAVTGIYYLIATMGILPGKAPPVPQPSERTSALPSGFDGAMLDRAVAAAQKAAPGQEIKTVILPFARNQGISFYGPEGGGAVHFSTTRVIVDPQTMTVIAKVRPEDNSIRRQAKHLFDPLHHGDWAGNYSRIAWLAFGAMGTVLMFSGAMVFATRIARLPAAGSTAPERRSAGRRVWSGMFVAKWALIPAAIAVAGIGVYRFGLDTADWVKIWPEGAKAPVELAVQGPLRANVPLPVRLSTDATGPARVLVRMNGGEPVEILLEKTGRRLTGTFPVLPGGGRNKIAVSLPGPALNQPETHWILGQPLF